MPSGPTYRETPIATEPATKELAELETGVGAEEEKEEEEAAARMVRGATVSREMCIGKRYAPRRHPGTYGGRSGTLYLSPQMPRFPLAGPCPPDAQPPAQSRRPHTILVLGGGAMHGMAHIGAIRALAQARIEIDAIVGTSIGALVGARWAMGASVAELEADALSVTEAAVLKRNLKAYLVGGLLQTAVYDGEHYRDLIQRLVAPATFASLIRPLRVNAMSLRNGDERWFGYGTDTSLGLVDAIYASGALPLIFPPLQLADGDLVVDGGLKTMVGLLEAIRWGARRIIAIDVSEVIDAEDVAWERQGIVGIHGRVVQILAEPQRAATQAAREHVPTLHVRPPVKEWPSFTFTATRELMDAGYEAMTDALNSGAAAGFHDAAPIGPAIVKQAGRTRKKRGS